MILGMEKEIEYKNTGITLAYWRLNCVEVDIECNVTKCRVGGYINKADAFSGKKAVDNIKYTFFGSNNPIGFMTDPREYSALLYAKIIEASPAFSAVNKLVGASLDIQEV